MKDDGEKEPWVSVGVVLKIRPDLVDDLLGKLERTDGIYVVFAKQSNLHLVLKAALIIQVYQWFYCLFISDVAQGKNSRACQLSVLSFYNL